MFTGLIEAIGVVHQIERRGESGHLILESRLAKNLTLGASIAVNGCCLTITSIHEHLISFDLLGETLSRTNLNALKIHSAVNLERPLSADGYLGGHFVQGHIDTTSEVIASKHDATGFQLMIKTPPSGIPYIVGKGSIAINGVSLTVCEINDESFDLWIIPHTMQETNLGTLKKGDQVNLEYDMIAKYVQRQLFFHLKKLENFCLESHFSKTHSNSDHPKH